jgi:hypothetical protein
MDIARWGLGVSDIGQSILSYGGRFAYEDAGQTANTQVSIHQYGDKRLVFEVRGLKTEQYKGAGVGNVFHGSEGYVVLTSYDKSAAFDLNGKMIQAFSGGGDDLHYSNFIKAVRSRKHEELNADILEGHLSSALCHLGNISYRLGSAMPASELAAQLKDDAEAAETLSRFTSHLTANGVKLDTVPVTVGPKLTIDPVAETIPSNEKASALLTREYRAPFVVPAAGQV